MLGLHGKCNGSEDYKNNQKVLHHLAGAKLFFLPNLASDSLTSHLRLEEEKKVIDTLVIIKKGFKSG